MSEMGSTRTREIEPELLDEAVLEGVLRTADEVPHPDIFPDKHCTEFTYGSKRLILGVSLAGGEALTRIDNISGAERKKNETTLLYRAAERLLQSTADKNKKTINYRLLTENEKMKDWANTKGETIFHWQHQGEYPAKGGFKALYLFEKDFIPNE